MSRNIEARNAMVNWQVAPAQHEIANYDEVKEEYRQNVYEIVHSIPEKSAKRLTFVIIHTNVMCADITTSVKRSNPHVEPIERDVYFPLEISLTKCSLSDMSKPIEERRLGNLHYMFKPCSPPANGSVQYAKDHYKIHKIDYNSLSNKDPVVETDYKKVVKEINAFLTPERVVYSIELQHCRQDLGSLKWLNRETNFIMKPIKVFSIEDLYVNLNRRLHPSDPTYICQGIARYKFTFEKYDPYDAENMCDYHKRIVKEDPDEGHTRWCSREITYRYANTFLDETFHLQQINQELRGQSDPSVGH